MVFLAQDLRHSRPVAIKVLRPELGAILGADRFLREIETVARLQHPHILPLYDSGEAAGLLYFVMPYVPGDSLRDRLEREHVLPLDDAIAVAVDVASALSYAHAQGVVHRDIKPENILLFGGAAVVADFGIARALKVAGEGRITEVGMALGTPLYMSPEQASASGEIDARSDIYSLGCVLYEMLGGRPPFTGISAADVLGHHLHDRPQPLNELRSSVPPPLAMVVAKALAKLPADRFHDVGEFAAALRAPTGVRHPIHVPVPRRRLWQAAAVAAALFVIAVLIARRPPRLDPTAWVIAPFEHADTLSARLLSSDRCQRRMRAALERWQGLHVVDPLVTASFAAQAPEGSRGFAPALDEALSLRAAYLVYGRVWTEHDSVHVRAGLYDVARGGRELATGEVAAALEGDDLDVQFARLADSLVVGRGHTVTSRSGLSGTHSIPAKDAWLAADSALGSWDLASADRGFEQALRLDPAFGFAALRAAQVKQWQGAMPADYGSLASTALAGSAAFTRADSLHAVALSAMVAGAYPAACDTYRALTRENATDVLAWYGLADCLYRDRAVVRAASSPSGWRFRASYDEGIRALRRAVAAAPAVHVAFQGGAWERLASRLYLGEGDVRVGRALAPDSGTFGAFAELSGDTLAFIPWPIAPLFAGEVGQGGGRTASAVQRNRDSLLAMTQRWRTLYPRSAAAWEAYARALEGARVLDSGATHDTTAADALRRARALTTDPATTTRLLVTQVRLALKSSHWSDAARLADEVLARPVVAGTEPLLAPVAALRGRMRLAAQLAESGDTALLPTGEPVAVPHEAMRLGRRLLVFAALGAPDDTLRAQADALRRVVSAVVSRTERERVFWALVNVPMAMAHPALRDVRATGDLGGNVYLAWWRRLDRGESGPVLDSLRTILQFRESLRMLPGDVEVYGGYLESRIAAAAGDTALALSRLASALDVPGAWTPRVIDEATGAAALVRAMILRADLAHAAGNGGVARDWARAARTLWDGMPDAELRPALERMRALAAR